jgi:hypothetical protein
MLPSVFVCFGILILQLIFKLFSQSVDEELRTVDAGNRASNDSGSKSTSESCAPPVLLPRSPTSDEIMRSRIEQWLSCVISSAKLAH